MDNFKTENEKIIQKLDKDRNILKSFVVSNVETQDGKKIEDYEKASIIVEICQGIGNKFNDATTLFIKQFTRVLNAKNYVDELDEVIDHLNIQNNSDKIDEIKLIDENEFEEKFDYSKDMPLEFEGKFVKVAYVFKDGTFDQICYVTTRPIDLI